MIVFGLPMMGIDWFTFSALGIEKASKVPKQDLYFGEIVTPTMAVLPAEYYASSAGSELAVAQTQMAYQVMELNKPTAQPTYTPYPTPTGIVYPLSSHKFSFYDPMIGKDKPEIRYINCDEWNDVTQYCDSAMRSGESWEANYFRAAACPYSLYVERAEFLVVSPDWLVKLFPNGFVCKDTGEAVTGQFIDFLIPWKSMPMDYSETPWATAITLQRIK